MYVRPIRITRRWLRYLLPAAGVVVVLAGGGFAALETDTVSSYGEGVWWAWSLVTTVGFAGDTPVTTAGRVLAGFLMAFGFGMLSLVTAAVASIFILEDEEPVERREAAFEASALEQLATLNQRLERLERRLEGPAGEDRRR